MPGPEPSVANGQSAPVPPPTQQQQPPDSGVQQGPTYPSLAYPSAGPSQQPHFSQQGQGGWGYQQPFYGYQPHNGGGPQRTQPGNNFQPGGFQPNFQYPYPPQFGYAPPYGQMPMPGPGPASMQNGYYVGGNFGRQYGGYDGREDGNPNGGDDGSSFHPNQMPFQQPYYPPNHPYAYGGGVGYPQPMQQYGNGGYRGDGFMHDHQQGHHAAPPPPSSGKALNPAAHNFTFPVRKTSSAANGSLPNGHAESVTEIVAPVAQKPELGSLGLSLEPASKPTTPAAPAVDAPAHEPDTAEPKPDMAAEHAQEAPEAKAGPATPKAEPAPVEPATPEAQSIKFTGATLEGYKSPAGRTRKSLASDPICIRPRRPSPEEATGTAFAAHLTRLIPECVSTQRVEGIRKRRSTAGYAKPKSKAVFAAGASGGRTAPAVTLIFGSICNAPATPVALAPATIPTPLSPPRATKPPSSWASLLRTNKSRPNGTPDSLSVAASSTFPSALPSPSKSVSSLPSEAGPSRTPLTDDPTTPRSAVPSLPPSVSAGPAQPRPAFNYAAAAAVGAPLTPAEDLARLLTDGLRARPAHAPAAVYPRGLINTGNMCFANTILQVLVYCTPFTELFEELGRRLKADLARRTPLLEAMVIFLREFTPGPSSNGTATPKGKSREDAFVPENVYDAMKENKRFDSMRRGYQEDAEEYLGFFLNTLHEELLGLYSRIQPPRPAKAANANGSERTIDRPVSPGAAGAADDDWLEVGKKQKTHVVRTAESRESAVSRIFGGSLRSVLHAPGQKDSVTLEPYQPLQLDVQAAQVLNLADALRHLNEPETVPGVWSAARGANVDATKQVFFESFPQVLILHLKRFVYDPQEQNVVKRSKPVAYGTELVIPQEVISAPKRTANNIKYRLFGVVYHHGHSATGGHYTVAVSRPDNSGWLHFDDEAVHPVPVEEVVVSDDEAKNGRAGTIGGRERCAYLLFYQRVR